MTAVEDRLIASRDEHGGERRPLITETTSGGTCYSILVVDATKLSNADLAKQGCYNDTAVG